MRYMFLIYGDPASDPTDEAQIKAEIDEYWAYDRALTAAGAFISGEALQGVQTATTVRLRGGDQLVTDGPFAETREILGGYYLVDLPDLDTAVSWATRCPGARRGTIEIRPIMEYDEP
ncbi:MULTISPECIES: YciI family protein [unclassified Solwaraspora]|uniref:YciI family protein n=1 Tax=unclassified Solwaraspora TaxID=2627926 RepID=UPI00259B9C9B|nr:YciI family protein [Solwaraspora sp. WMMA2056]WJK38795.1 YciI family protein [Solwaraspora sp. WMMA2056]